MEIHTFLNYRINTDFSVCRYQIGHVVSDIDKQKATKRIGSGKRLICTSLCLLSTKSTIT